MRKGPLTGRYPAVATMVVFALVPYLGLSVALQPLSLDHRRNHEGRNAQPVDKPHPAASSVPAGGTDEDVHEEDGCARWTLLLRATFTFAIGSALIHSHFSSGTSRDGTLVAGVFLLACTGLAAVTNGLAMHSVLTRHTRLRSQAYLILRAVECLTIVAIGG